MPGPPQQPSLYNAYVQPALTGLRRAAEGVGQAVGLTSAPDAGAMDGVRRAAQQGRLDRAYGEAQRQMPGLKPVKVGLGGGMPSRHEAETSMFSGNVTFNQDRLDDLSDPELAETMTHELTHARQAQNTPILQKFYNRVFGSGPDEEVPAEAKGGSLDDPYYWRPRELEAFQAERERMGKSGRSLQRDPMSGHYDIFLPPERR